jgi:4-carboxymuconolactone decarboxylase
MTTETKAQGDENTTLATLFEQGLEIRRDVLGADYVDASLAKANDFTMRFQHMTTELCWGYIWNRPGLDRKTRSIINLAMLTALGKKDELGLHVRGAVQNGVSVDEIAETLMQATIYCGIPAGLEAFKAANEILQREGLL